MLFRLCRFRTLLFRFVRLSGHSTLLPLPITPSAFPIEKNLIPRKNRSASLFFPIPIGAFHMPCAISWSIGCRGSFRTPTLHIGSALPKLTHRDFLFSSLLGSGKTSTHPKSPSKRNQDLSLPKRWKNAIVSAWRRCREDRGIGFFEGDLGSMIDDEHFFPPISVFCGFFFQLM